MARINPIWAEHQRRRWMRLSVYSALPKFRSRIPEAKAERPSLFWQQIYDRKFRVDQLRVPRGQFGAGRFADENREGEAALRRASFAHEVSSQSRKLIRSGSRPHGHHYIPLKVYGRMNLRPETRKVFDEAKTGRLRSGAHAYDGDHRRYTLTVERLVKNFLDEHGIKNDIDITPDHAREIVSRVVDSKDPPIRNYNWRFWMNESMHLLRRGLRRGRE